MKKSQPTLQVWVAFIIATAGIIILSGMLYPQEIVLGNAIVPNVAAAIAVSTILTFFVAIANPFIKQRFFRNAYELQTVVLSGLLNIFGLWVLARLALYLGLGISSAVVAVALGVTITLVQYALTNVWGDKTKK